MHFKDLGKAVDVDVPEEVADFMRRQATKARLCETGGILIGRYSEDLSSVVVVQATAAPSDSKAGRFWFERGTAGLDKTLDRAWKNGLHYVGEWHFHPGAAPDASPSDRNQMSTIAYESKLHCPSPILIIIGDSGRDPKMSAYVQKSGMLLPLNPMLQDENQASVHAGNTSPSPRRRRRVHDP